MRNLVTKAVGAKETIDLDIAEIPLRAGDQYLLCSDGVHGALPDSEILDIVLAADGNPQKAVADLIAAANSSGGKDNVTALLLRCRSIDE